MIILLLFSTPYMNIHSHMKHSGSPHRNKETNEKKNRIINMGLVCESQLEPKAQITDF